MALQWHQSYISTAQISYLKFNIIRLWEIQKMCYNLIFDEFIGSRKSTTSSMIQKSIGASRVWNSQKPLRTIWSISTRKNMLRRARRIQLTLLGEFLSRRQTMFRVIPMRQQNAHRFVVCNSLNHQLVGSVNCAKSLWATLGVHRFI